MPDLEAGSLEPAPWPQLAARWPVAHLALRLEVALPGSALELPAALGLATLGLAPVPLAAQEPKVLVAAAPGEAEQDGRHQEVAALVVVVVSW